MRINTQLKQITANDVVVLANNRQVLAFKNTWMMEKGTSALPQILPWRQYLQNTWRALYPHTPKRLISVLESRALISQSMIRLGQVTDNRLLTEVCKNIDYCHAHLIKSEQLLQAHHQHYRLFGTWMQHYQQHKLECGLLDLNDLSALIIDTNTTLAKPIIYGFKTLTPEQSRLFAHIGYQTLSAEQPNTQSTNLSFKTSDDEILSAAKWAQALHKKHPEKHIVIVSPALNTLYHPIKSTFDQVFDDVLVETGQKAYNISLGLPLTQYPLIQHLLLILQLSQQLNRNYLETKTFNAVITSPYIAHAQVERSARAWLVNQVLSLSKTHFKLSAITHYLANTPTLKKLIDALTTQPAHAQQSHENWLLDFNANLQTWGFATDRGLSSAEHQLLDKYQQTSLGLNLLAQIHDKVNAKNALADLENWLSCVIFQAKAANTPIQVLGSLEAEGLYFDAAWVLGMNADFLPAALNSPRFIPTNIAVAHQIPHSNFALIAKDAQSTLNNLINLADEVICSYAKTHFEHEQHSSPLLKFSPQDKTPKSSYLPMAMEQLIDRQSMHLSNTQVRGGVSILKAQMACSFKGFAHRLNIPNFDQAHIGLSRAEQGDIIHKVLEKIYQNVASSDELSNDDVLNPLISTSIKTELNRYPKSGFIQIEHQRLTPLIQKFIDTEKQRNNFKVIATEQNIKVNIAGLSFKVRLDRMDELENGERIIFDYKTGNIPSNPWCGEPIKEPQLPIYVLNEQAQGIAFIKPTLDKVSYLALAKNQDSLPNKTKQQQSCRDWEQQLKLWQQQLNQASDDYQSGKAAVLPTQHACQYCQYDSLCRVEK